MKQTSGKKETGAAEKSATEIARERAMALAKQRAMRAQSTARRERATKSERPLTPEELKAFRELLVELRGRISGQVKALRTESLTRDDEVNTEEDGSDAFERLFSLERAGSESDVIYEIDEAIRRIDNGAYGGCESCEKVIERARLKALPFVKTCIDCQSDAERDRSAYSAIRSRFN